MPGPYRRIDHPNPNSFVVSADAAPKKAKAVKKAAPAAAAEPDESVKAQEPASAEPAAKSD